MHGAKKEKVAKSCKKPNGIFIKLLSVAKK